MEPQPPQDDGVASRRQTIIGLIGVSLFLAYLLLWWNSYFAPNVGGEVFMMNEYRHGRLPYRDYYSHQPPGIPLLLFGLFELFGVRLLPYELVGLVARTAAVWVVYRTLAREGRSPVVASISAAAAAIAACSDDAEYVGSYHHLSVALLVAAAASARACVVERGRSSRAFAISAAVAGAAAAACFSIKQTAGTVGTGLVLAFSVLALVHQKRGREAAALLGWGALGFAALALPVVAWLARHDLLGPYVRLVYGVAPAAKGGVLASLLRPVLGIPAVPRLIPALVLALLVVGAAAAAMFAGRLRGVAQSPGVATAGGAAALAFAALLVGRSGTALGDPFKVVLLAPVYVGLLGTLALGALHTARLWRDPDDRSARHGAFVSWTGFACAYSLAISWPAFEPMVYPSVAVVVTELDFAMSRHPLRRHAEVAGAALLLVIVALSSWRHHSRPFQWAYWASPPVRASEYRSKEPALAGIMMSRETAEFIDGATDLIRANSGADDTVLTFPHLSLLAGLADRRVAGFVPVYWFDTCSDGLARADAATIAVHPPAVIVWLDLPPGIFEEQELFFRNGLPSGQRELASAVHQLVNGLHYRELAQFPAPGVPFKVRIFARPREGGTTPPAAPTLAPAR